MKSALVVAAGERLQQRDTHHNHQLRSLTECTCSDSFAERLPCHCFSPAAGTALLAVAEAAQQ
jgi:hypothetical protein